MSVLNELVIREGRKEGDLEAREKLDMRPSFISNKENQPVELQREVQQLGAFLGADSKVPTSWTPGSKVKLAFDHPPPLRLKCLGLPYQP